jgi:hypothetical protein
MATVPCVVRGSEMECLSELLAFPLNSALELDGEVVSAVLLYDRNHDDI